ncbi:nuclear transport factor 2 family protein [Adhaeribacter rhizoryzae]|uniref:Nuclear transport factor 2 family protein n=1 Tax=Adhaeribacter rhizoryzae TaxID=2607907 RepID=A0A5M6CWA2_9BACT|nr:nuclear transport factor 2 family protein [Adhaeribacter rhizoryzae]KAA5539363.1 nuclear transport factor 2 family protein [Adhaeribacter rhizoryzae]
MKKEIYFVLAFLSVVGGCSDNTSTRVQDSNNSQRVEAPNPISEDKTKQVLDHHWDAFTQNNMEAVMADYTEESVLITPDATFKGLDEIRKNFENAFITFPRDITSFQLNKSVVDRDVAYILWQAKTPTLNLSYATDTFVIRDGKIIRQTYAGVAKD